MFDARRRTQGEEHPDTLVSMNNLAVTLQSLGFLDRSRALQERAIELQGRIKGEEHPSTLRFDDQSVSNAAGTRRLGGRASTTGARS